MKPAISPARVLAFDCLLAVDGGAYASDYLVAHSASLGARDAGLASEIVFGVLRFRAQLDYLTEFFSGARKLDREVRTALRMGIYQLRYLDRVPPHAAVGESVELVKRARKRSAAGLVNAALRKVTRSPAPWPDRASELSVPGWMLERWERQYGGEAAEGIARAALSAPETYIRVPSGAALPEGAEPAGTPGCYRIARAPEGYRIQDIGSQSVVPLLRLAPGQSLLDLCAAPGNKTAQALESGVRAVACDIHRRRLERLRKLGAELVVLDGTRPLPFGRRFDRILLDAPCSGTGTLARNPEIKWRLKPEQIVELQGIQCALLAQARAALAPGGLMVYSTCSLEHEENEDVIAAVPYGLVVETMRRIPGREPGDGFFAAVIKSEQPAND